METESSITAEGSTTAVGWMPVVLWGALAKSRVSVAMA